MKQNALLIEQITLAEEILEFGAGEGRAIRLAAVTLQLHEILSAKNAIMPDGWRTDTRGFPVFDDGMLDIVEIAWGDKGIECEQELCWDDIHMAEDSEITFEELNVD